MKVEIEKVENGYIARSIHIGGYTTVSNSLEELFNQLLLMFEGLSESFSGNRYGKIVIQRKKESK